MSGNALSDNDLRRNEGRGRVVGAESIAAVVLRGSTTDAVFCDGV